MSEQKIPEAVPTNLSQLALYLSGILVRDPNDSRLSLCGICEKHRLILEHQRMILPTTPEHLRASGESVAICWDCSAPSWAYDVSPSLRNHACKCGSGKKFKACCLQLCTRANSTHNYGPINGQQRPDTDTTSPS